MKASQILSALLILIGSSQSKASNYFVPVTDPILKAYSHYQIQKPQVLREGSLVQIIHDLPRELSGAPFSVKMSGFIARDQKNFNLEGPFGTAICLAQRCEIYYRSIIINPDLVRAQVLANSYTQEQATSRLQLAKIFEENLKAIFILNEDPTSQD